MADYAESDFCMDLSLVDDSYPCFEYLRAHEPGLRLPAHGAIAFTGFAEALAVRRISRERMLARLGRWRSTIRITAPPALAASPACLLTSSAHSGSST